MTNRFQDVYVLLVRTFPFESWYLQKERNFPEGWMPHDRGETGLADKSFADVVMPVNSGAAGSLGVVGMDDQKI
jgi:hypothetical protein